MTDRRRLVAAVLATALLAIGVTAGCEQKGGGLSYQCSCKYISDTDVPMNQTFTVCADSDNGANAAARSCQGPGKTSSCSCTRSNKPCQSGCR